MTCIIGKLTNEEYIHGSLEIECPEVDDMASGWIKVTDVTPQASPDTVTGKVYQDPPSNTVLQEAVSSGRNIAVAVRASYPLVVIGGVSATLTLQPDDGHYYGVVNVTLPTQVSSIYDVVAEVITPDNNEGATDTVRITLELAPQILTLAFTGNYPSGQTELKQGDTFLITGTLDKQSNEIDIINFGAFSGGAVAIALGTSFSISGTVADRGTTLQALAARVRAKDPVTGAYGPTRDTNQGGGSVDRVNLVNLNNIRPTIVFGTPAYPGSQGALKNAEQASVSVTLANYDTFLYESPNSELNVVGSTSSLATVTRAGGTYNVSTPNLRATATRAANGSQTQVSTVIRIAHVAAALTVTPPASRMRSGGNDGTSIQDHLITLTSSQMLQAAPSISPDTNGGSFIGPGFVGGPTVWTRTLQVHDDDTKGSRTWSAITATNLAGLVTNAIAVGAQYVLGGFVARDLTFAPFSTEVDLNTQVMDFNKLQAGIFTATDNPALKQIIGTISDVDDGYTIDVMSANPTSLKWLDVSAAASNSSGTAQITAVEELA